MWPWSLFPQRAPQTCWGQQPLPGGVLHCAALHQPQRLPQVLRSLRPGGPVALVDLDGLWGFPSPWPEVPTYLLRSPAQASPDLLGKALVRYGAFSVVLWLWSASQHRPGRAWDALPELAGRHRQVVWVAVGAGPTPWRCSWLSRLRYKGSVLE